MSVAWSTPIAPVDSGFSVIFSEFADVECDEEDFELRCLHCVLEDGDQELGRGLDLARQHGQVDRDPETGEWRVPDAWERVHGLRPRDEA